VINAIAPENLAVCTEFSKDGKPLFVYAAEFNLPYGLISDSSCTPLRCNLDDETEEPYWSGFSDEEGDNHIIINTPETIESDQDWIRFSSVNPQRVQDFINGICAVLHTLKALTPKE